LELSQTLISKSALSLISSRRRLNTSFPSTLLTESRAERGENKKVECIEQGVGSRHKEIRQRTADAFSVQIDSLAETQDVQDRAERVQDRAEQTKGFL
jgi:hypothetical protein